MQQDLFDTPKKDGDDFLYNQLVKLGDMMGDGLHHEPDGQWISREYARITKLLMPEHFAEIRKQKAASVDIQMTRLLSEKKCSCGGSLQQSRKGSKVAYCMVCRNRYKAGKKK